MNEEQLSQLPMEDKLKVMRYLIADLASNMLHSDKTIAHKARHDTASLAMTMNNLYELVASNADDTNTVLQAMKREFSYRASEHDSSA